MSFGTYARKVRDPQLPLRVRTMALRSAVVHYQPLGWRATLSFLEQVAGHYRADESALMRALDLLEDSRRIWQVQVRKYAETRRIAKGRGCRSPRPADPNPFRRPTGWYGPLRPAASLHALTFWRERMPTGDPLDSDVEVLVAAALDSEGELTPEQEETLATVSAALEQRVFSTPWSRDPDAHFRATNLLRTVEFLAAARQRADPD